ncbi:hypothetical protein [Maribacter sp.]|uniref:hypothetical protein n=1 Tax=Maribacter sp. TaxID=1897614 RepID=UPI003298794A
MLLKIYRILTYIFLVLLIVALSLSAYEYLIQKRNVELDGLSVNVIIICLFIIVGYYLLKTKNIFLLKPNETLKKVDLVGFKFDKETGIGNFLAGLAITVVPIYIFLIYPIIPLDAKEILRISLLLLVGFYGILKMNYTIHTLKIIFDLNKN